MRQQDLTLLAPRMWAKVDISEWEADPAAHWYWTATTAGSNRRAPEGYGRINFKRRTVYAHRFFYELLVGPIPDGYQIDHLCRVTYCVNPDHLEAVTPSTNVRRSKIHPSVIQRNKTHCKHGHPYSGENVQIDALGRRRCRACSRRANLRKSEEAHQRRVARYIDYLTTFGYQVTKP